MYGVMAGDMIGKPYECRKGSVLCEVIKRKTRLEPAIRACIYRELLLVPPNPLEGGNLGSLVRVSLQKIKMVGV